MDKITLKSWFLRGKKPTAYQFESWIDSYWHKDEKLPITSIDQLAEALAGKLDIGTLQERIDGNTTTFLSVHALVNSINMTEDLTITGVACNRNCKTLIFVDKEDPSNMLPVEIEELKEEFDNEFDECSGCDNPDCPNFKDSSECSGCDNPDCPNFKDSSEC